MIESIPEYYSFHGKPHLFLAVKFGTVLCWEIQGSQWLKLICLLEKCVECKGTTTLKPQVCSWLLIMKIGIKVITKDFTPSIADLPILGKKFSS